MKYIKEYLEEKLRVRPIGEITTEPYEEYCDAYTGEEIIIDGCNTGIKITYIDYISWLESSKFISPKEDNEVTYFRSTLVPEILFPDKESSSRFDKSLKHFYEAGKEEWKEAVNQFASKEAVDYNINVLHKFQSVLNGPVWKELSESLSYSINDDYYCHILNHLSTKFNTK